MDEHLKWLAEAGLALTHAEDSLGANEHHSAAQALDEADQHLARLREMWIIMGPAARTLVARTAAPLRQRLDAGRARLAPRAAVTQGAPEHDPEQDVDPAA